MFETYIREQITAFRTARGLSERQLSLDIGRNPSYINGISNEKNLPSMGEFLYICEFLGITPFDFFKEEPEYSINKTKARTLIAHLDDSTVDILLPLLVKLQAEKDCATSEDSEE